MHRILIKINSYKKFIYKQIFKERHYLKSMDSVDLHPPNNVRGMTVLDRNAFRKQIYVSKLKVTEECLNKILPIIKSSLLKMEHLRPVRNVTKTEITNSCNGGGSSINEKNSISNDNNNLKEILLHPLVIKNWNDVPKDVTKYGVSETNFSIESFELTYDNWRADEILKFILPENKEGLTSYSRIGHIVHVNLRDHLLPYKQIIGEILKDKTVGCRTVVNKAQNISNTYRNFNLELIYGEPDYKVETKEHSCIFEFDFSKVYWNPRLSTEHDRIVQLLNQDDVLYDVFAGVGPFTIPAAKKKKCNVLANDLNPESFKWLNVNVKRNKCTNLVQTFNKDGREFILNDIKRDLLERWKSNKTGYKIHITMNLPAMAIEFLDVFNNLFTTDEIEEFINSTNTSFNMPIIHVYTFVKDENNKDNSIKGIVEKYLGHQLHQNLIGIYFVRNVAPNKNMYRISFQLNEQILFKTLPITTSCLRKRQTSSPDNCVDEKKICEKSVRI